MYGCKKVVMNMNTDGGYGTLPFSLLCDRQQAMWEENMQILPREALLGAGSGAPAHSRLLSP